jgi:hypothetical protein
MTRNDKALKKKNNPDLLGLFFMAGNFLNFSALVCAHFKCDYLSFFKVLMHFVQVCNFLPSTVLVWRLIYWRFKVLMFECEREASLVVPLPQISQFFAIFLK